MPKFARLEGADIRETMVADSLPPFHPSLDWRPCPDIVIEGYTYDQGTDTWTPPVPLPLPLPRPPDDESVTRALLIEKGVFDQDAWNAKKVSLST